MSDKRRNQKRKNQERRRNQSEKSRDVKKSPAVQASLANPFHVVKESDCGAGAKGPNVVIALATTGTVHEQTLASIQRMIRATRKAAGIEMWWQVAYPGGKCRNQLVERFLRDKTKTHLLFIDTDMGVPEKGLDLLLETGEPLICGPAAISTRVGSNMNPNAPFRLTTNIMDAADASQCGEPTDPEDPLVEYRYQDLDELPDIPFACDVSGMSFCLIAREVLEKMEAPWYYFVDLPDRTNIGLDVYFFRKASKLGYRCMVHPEAMCDHIKVGNLTKFEQWFVPNIPDPRWAPKLPKNPPKTMVLTATSKHWVDIRIAETLMVWTDRPNKQVGTRLYETMHADDLLIRYLNDPAFYSDDWERILILESNVIPNPALPEQLASVDAPIVSTISRSIFQGQMAYNYANRDPQSGKLTFAEAVPVHMITDPFEVDCVDLAGAMIHRDVLKYVPEARRFACDKANPAEAFTIYFNELVTKHTGRRPVVVPVVVERMADLGLLGMLRLKHQLVRKSQEQKPEPVGV